MRALLRDRSFLLALAAGVAVAALGGHLATPPGAPPAPGAGDGVLRWAGVGATVLLYPVLEEIVFRGWLQGGLLARGWHRRLVGLSAANLTTSLLFAGLHGWVTGSAGSLAVVFPSLVFGHFRERQQGLSGPVTLHIAYNAAWVLGSLA